LGIKNAIQSNESNASPSSEGLPSGIDFIGQQHIDLDDIFVSPVHG
jgi:hypothetical protein